MESLRAFFLTFSAGLLFFIAAAVFLSFLTRRMRIIRFSNADQREKKLRGLVGMTASLSVLPCMLPAMYTISAGTDRAESAVIVSIVFAIPLALFVARSLASSFLTMLSGRNRK